MKALGFRLWAFGLAVVTVSANLAAIELVSVKDEIEIGKSAAAEVRKKTPVLRDAPVTAYVRSVGRRLAASAPGPKYPYTFNVTDYREINAFALPGGPVWVNRGVLQAAGNESQLAAVLAHEVAHVAQRHAADQLTKIMIAKWGLGFLGAVLGSSGGASSAQVAAGLLANGIFLKFSRDDERDADRVGLRILTRAGWDGRGMMEFFEVLHRESQRDPNAVEVFFSTHPSTQDRIALIRTEPASRRASGRRDSSAFRQMKQRLRTLPAPRRMENR